MAKLPQRLPLEQMAVRWATELDPLLANKLTNGLLLEGINLKVGTNVINHLLSRKQQGYIITDINANANIYRSAPLNALTLTLTSDAAATVSVWVF